VLNIAIQEAPIKKAGTTSVLSYGVLAKEKRTLAFADKFVCCILPKSSFEIKNRGVLIF
jgi:hypothetical protein